MEKKNRGIPKKYDGISPDVTSVCTEVSKALGLDFGVVLGVLMAEFSCLRKHLAKREGFIKIAKLGTFRAGRRVPKREVILNVVKHAKWDAQASANL